MSVYLMTNRLLSEFTKVPPFHVLNNYSATHQIQGWPVPYAGRW